MNDPTNTLREGTYNARATRASITKSKSGTPFVLVDFRVIDGPQADKTIQWRGYLTDKAAAGTLRALEACGVNGDLEDLSGINEHVVELVVIAETDPTGTAETRVRWVNRITQGPGTNVVSKDEIKSLAARFNTKSISQKNNSPTHNNTDADDDIRF